MNAVRSGRTPHSLELLRLLNRLGSVLLVLTTGCGGAVATATYELECETGTMGCSCYGNWSCNYQLSCVEDVCVDRKSPLQTDGLVEPEPPHSEPAPDPLADATSDQCLECLQADCSAALEACYPETGCIAHQACLLECRRSGKVREVCEGRCSKDSSIDAHKKSALVTECREQRCGMCGKSN